MGRKAYFRDTTQIDLPHGDPLICVLTGQADGSNFIPKDMISSVSSEVFFPTVLLPFSHLQRLSLSKLSKVLSSSQLFTISIIASFFSFVNIFYSFFYYNRIEDKKTPSFTIFILHFAPNCVVFC